MMKAKALPSLLCIDTATNACSVALSKGGYVFERYQEGNNIHSQVVLEMVSAILDEAHLLPAQLDAVAVSQGPGSFTGLRIGIGVAQGLAYAVDCPMIGVSSLATLALQVPADGTVLATIDARMGEVYWCEYAKQGQHLQSIGKPQVSQPELLAINASTSAGATLGECYLVGNAWQVYLERFSSGLMENSKHLAGIVFPRAIDMLGLAQQLYVQGEMVAPAQFTPIYIRDDVAKKSQKNVLTGKAV
jgi:tRNA threonylcarbamoyladenosine biosynthesis protein TsaB